MARLWRRHRKGALVLSDDRTVVRWRDGRPWIYGTPWHGSGRYASPRGAPLRAIFFLRQSSRTRVKILTAPRAGAELFARCFPPIWEAEGVGTVLQTCARLLGAVPAYELGSRADGSAVRAVDEALAGPGMALAS